VSIASGPHGGDGELVARALGLAPGDLLDLSLSLNPVAPDLRPIIERHLDALGHYPDPSAAHRALADAIGVAPERLLLTNGGSEAIALVSGELGGHVEEPEFSLHPRGIGPLWRSNPNNPTGLLAPANARAGVWDEAFYPLASGHWTRGDADAVVVGSLTKLLACPGLRVGFVLADPGLIERCARTQTLWSVNGLVCAALPELLASVDLVGWAGEIQALRHELTELARRFDLCPRPSDANWVLLEAPGLRERLAPHGILLRDCANFGLPGIARMAVPRHEHFPRLAQSLEAALTTKSSPGGLAARTGANEKGNSMSPTSHQEAARRIGPVNKEAASLGAQHHDRLTKPRGSLGRLEDLGIQLCAISGECPPPIPEPVTVAVFAGDHGVVKEGVTPWPQEVTGQMVANFCAQGAAVNVLARHVGARVLVVDVGVATPIPEDAPGLLHRRVRHGTANLARGPAMTLDEVNEALDVGTEIAGMAVSGGARLLVTGDMGIGNTTPSAALIAAFTGRTPDLVTGRGTGIDDSMLHHKVDVVRKALTRLGTTREPHAVLAELGGLEIAALAGFIIGGAAAGVPVVIDGVIAGAAALAAVAIAPGARDYLIAGHRSSEPGATVALTYLGLTPVLDLGLRLGEGSGAVLAVPTIQAAAKILTEMATFDAAGVSDKDA
jgi:nicotinate-nucleotide--dimethylbenzimidazole phosphoribosyltransferase